MDKPSKEQPLIVNVEKMSYGPDAIAHLDSGKVVFIPNAVPGDVLDIEVVNEKPKMAQAKIVEVIEPSDIRVSLKAPELADSLCPWQQIEYVASLAQKRQIVIDALARVGHLNKERVEVLVSEVAPSEQEWSYRNKVEFACSQDDQGHLILGFHEHKSSSVHPISSCLVANERIAECSKKLTGALRYALGDASSDLLRIGMRCSEITNSLEVALWTVPGSIQRDFIAKAIKDAVGPTSIVRIISSAGSARRVKKLETLGGKGYWKERIAGSAFKVSAPSFFQVNTRQAEKMVELTLSALGDIEGKFVADLYCGVGTFSIPLAKRGADLACIELAGSSVSDLRENLATAGVDADVICDDVERVLPEFDDLDAVVVDPPRAGLTKSVVDQILSSRPERMVYISCDPQTLARDIARLESGGMKLNRCTPVDMFPQTYHIECVCELSF